MYCKHCGQQIDDNAAFCQHCGRTIATQESERIAPVKSKRTPLVVGIIIACVIVIGLIGVFVKKSADIKRAEEEALAASIAEAESIAQAEKIAEEARAEYINNLIDFVTLSRDGVLAAEDICRIVYMVWYDTVFEEYREETAAYTMTDGVYHTDVKTSFDALAQSDEMSELATVFVEYKTKVSKLFNQLSNPPDELADCYEAAKALMDDYATIYAFANYYPDGSLAEYSEYFDEYTNAYLKNYEKIIMLIPKD